METKADTREDPWDAALFGGAASSMYKTTPSVSKAQPPLTPAPKPQSSVSGDVTSLFKASAGIPRDIAPSPIPELLQKKAIPEPSPQREAAISIPIRTKQPSIPQPKKEAELVLSPLTPLDILKEVPHPPVAISPIQPMTKELKALPPAHPVATFVSHALVVLVGIPLFAAGFYLADYTKDEFAVKNVAAMQAPVLETATSTQSH